MRYLNGAWRQGAEGLQTLQFHMLGDAVKLMSVSLFLHAG